MATIASKADSRRKRCYFPWDAPPYSRGEFDFGGAYTSVVEQTDRVPDVRNCCCSPCRSRVGRPGRIGGANEVMLPILAVSAAQRSYHGAFLPGRLESYFTSLTLNLGLRWDWFSPTGEKYNAQANFVPGNPSQGAEFIIPTQRKNNPALSSSFTQLLAQDGIDLVYSDAYGSGLSQYRKRICAPRFGLPIK